MGPSLHEYDFNVICRVGMVNRHANGPNQNPSSKEEDIIKVCWHGVVDLEVILRWHASTYLCTFLRCYNDVI